MRCKKKARTVISYKKHIQEVLKEGVEAYERGRAYERNLIQERQQEQTNTFAIAERKNTITRVLDSIAQSLTAASHVVTEIGQLERK